MKIYISGKPYRTNKQEIVGCLQWVAEKLFPVDIVDGLQINLTFRDRLVAHENSLGSCATTGERHPRLFFMELDDMLVPHKSVRTILHEMVHVEQLVYGKLRRLTKEKIFWKGAEVNDSISWKEKPWEMEAILMEDSLFKDYQKYKAKQRRNKNV